MQSGTLLFFQYLKKTYHDFAIALQEISIQSERLSRGLVKDMKSNIKIDFLTRYHREALIHSERQRIWNIGEMTVFALSLGITGFYVLSLNWGYSWSHTDSGIWSQSNTKAF